MTTATEARLPRLSPQDTGKALRAALKAAFPETKFSVRMSRGTAYGSFDVDWTDGPTTEAVRAVTRLFVGRSFDGRDDSESYTRNAIEWKGARYETGAGYISTQRHHSPEAMEWAAGRLRELFVAPMESGIPGAARMILEAGCVGEEISAQTLRDCAHFHHMGERAPIAAPIAVEARADVEASDAIAEDSKDELLARVVRMLPQFDFRHEGSAEALRPAVRSHEIKGGGWFVVEVRGVWWTVASNGGEFNVRRVNCDRPSVGVPIDWHDRPLNEATIAARIRDVIAGDPVQWSRMFSAEENAVLLEATGIPSALA